MCPILLKCVSVMCWSAYAGPLDYGKDDPFYAMTFEAPVFIHNVSETETFGANFSITNCPRDICYISKTRSKYCE